MSITTRAVVLALTSLTVAAAPAAAHVGVKSYSPKRGSTVPRTLERVKVTFKGRITDGHLTVRNARGTKVSRGNGSVVSGDRVLRVRLKRGLTRGRYSVAMQVLNTDGHVMSKSWSFHFS